MRRSVELDNGMFFWVELFRGVAPTMGRSFRTVLDVAKLSLQNKKNKSNGNMEKSPYLTLSLQTPKMHLQRALTGKIVASMQQAVATSVWPG